jgi:hypothetical protein
VLDISLPHMGAMRHLARALGMDARAAAVAGDGARALADLEAMLGLAGHAREAPVLICDLVSVAIYALAADVTGRIIAERPGVLDDGQLRRLSERFGSFAGGTFPLRLDSESAFIEDFLQRAYTDDGNGDGRFCWKGVEFIAALSDPPEKPEFYLHFVSPVSVMAKASRREMSAKWRELILLAMMDESVPRWQRDVHVFDDEVERIEVTPGLDRRYTILMTLAPAVWRARETMAQVRQTREGVLTAIAIERYRLARGAYPVGVAELSPEFMASPGVDTFDGAMLRYRVREGVPVLYALGSDLDDDGGMLAERGNTSVLIRREAAKQSLAKDGDLILWPPPREERWVPP